MMKATLPTPGRGWLIWAVILFGLGILALSAVSAQVNPRMGLDYAELG